MKSLALSLTDFGGLEAIVIILPVILLLLIILVLIPLTLVLHLGIRVHHATIDKYALSIVVVGDVAESSTLSTGELEILLLVLVLDVLTVIGPGVVLTRREPTMRNTHIIGERALRTDKGEVVEVVPQRGSEVGDLGRVLLSLGRLLLSGGRAK